MSARTFNDGEELFVVAQGDGSYHLYAPLRHVVASINGGALESVRRFVVHGDGALTPADRRVITELRSVGLFVEPIPAPPIAPDDYLFRPHEVTLFPTTRCNLRCTYCYAEAGSRRVDMPWEMARASIETVIENARAVGREDFIVGFHGGGEPTVAWGLLERATLYAERRARETDLDVKIHCATNGVLAPHQRDFIVEHFTGVNVSLDGPPEIQDRQRPLASGDGSYVRVAESLDDFHAREFPFGIRVTLTDGGGPGLTEIVRFVHSHWPRLDQLHVEPVWQCGRCRTTGDRPPSPADFVAAYVEASEVARELGFRLFYSGARLDALTNKFCAASGDGFAVTPDGWVTSCFEVTDPFDSRSELFHYGRYDASAGAFAIDDARIARLRRLRVEHLPHCRDCFCKWHCAGDCLAKSLQGVSPGDHSGSPRCELNREITRLELARVVREAGGKAGADPQEERALG